MSYNYEPYEVSSIKDKWESIRQFLLTILREERIVRSKGVKVILSFNNLEKIDQYLSDFDDDFNRIVSAAESVNIQIKSQLLSLESKGIIDQMIHLSIYLTLKRNEIPDGVDIYNFIFGFSKFLGFNGLISKRDNEFTRLYEDHDLGFRSMTVFINKAIRCAERLKMAIYDKIQSDDDLFTPSNINPEIAVEKLLKAKLEIENSPKINDVQKKYLLSRIDIAIVELKKPRQDWPKIIGILVIVAALVSGIADMKGAVNNITDAYNYIIGSSIVPIAPSQRLLTTGP